MLCFWVFYCRTTIQMGHTNDKKGPHIHTNFQSSPVLPKWRLYIQQPTFDLAAYMQNRTFFSAKFFACSNTMHYKNQFFYKIIVCNFQHFTVKIKKTNQCTGSMVHKRELRKSSTINFWSLYSRPDSVCETKEPCRLLGETNAHSVELGFIWNMIIRLINMEWDIF